MCLLDTQFCTSELLCKLETVYVCVCISLRETEMTPAGKNVALTEKQNTTEKKIENTARKEHCTGGNWEGMECVCLTERQKGLKQKEHSVQKERK